MDMVVHDDDREEFRKGGLTTPDHFENNGPFFMAEWGLIPVEPPGEADGPPGVFPVGHVTAGGVGVHDQRIRSGHHQASPQICVGP